MDIRVLKYFLAAAEEENITKAAESFNIAQPSMSRQLMQLEEELGAKLFERSKKGIVLTEEGRLLRHYAEEITALSDRTRQVFLSRKNQLGGTIAIGCTETLGAAILPRLIKDFTAEYPEVSFDIVFGNTDTVKEKTLNGIMDIGFVVEPVNHESFEYVNVDVPLRWGFIMHKDLPLAKEKYITPEMLNGKPLLLPQTEGQRKWFKEWFYEGASHMNVLVNFTSISGAMQLASTGIGYTLSMQSAISYTNSNIMTFVPLEPARLAEASLIYGKKTSPSPIVRKFIDNIHSFKV